MKSSQTKKVYNDDVISNGGYLYTGKRIYSACIATQKQTDEIYSLTRRVMRKRGKRILDMGCGDGVYTIDLFEHLHPKKIVGFDMVEEAIAIAKKRVPKSNSSHLMFEIGDIYTLSKSYKKGQFDFGILRGVLHHLENPQKGIHEVSKAVDSVIVLEPNGFNPIMRLIEKISPYHRKHGEKSYWPPSLDRWFENDGYHVAYKKYFCIVPYFCPTWMAKLLKRMEPKLENLPIINRFYCGAILILYEK